MRSVALGIAMYMLTSVCYSENVGDWYVGTADDGSPVAFTINDSSALFGKWCDADKQTCFWLVASPDVSCDTGHQSSGLVSSDLGAMSITTTCVGTATINSKTYWRSVLSEPDTFDAIAKQSNALGIAIAMQSGEFRVMRFPMKGSDKALDLWARHLASWAESREKMGSNTKDVVL